jgi:hypothetical protein
VMQLYRPPEPQFEGIVVRLDTEPTRPAPASARFRR